MRNKFFAFVVLGSRSSNAFVSLCFSRRFYASSLAMAKKVLVPIAEGYEETKVDKKLVIDCH